MAHESRLFIYHKSNQDDEYGLKVAMFDLCRVPHCYEKFKEYPETSLHVYLDCGDIRTTEDRYGEPIREIPLKDAIEIIESDVVDKDYRRYAPCLALMKAFDDRWEGELVVLHYGY